MELQIEGRNLDIRKSWQEKIGEERARLDRHHPGLVHRLRVAIEETSRHQEGGYEVLLVASVPAETAVVKRKGEKVRSLLVEAFDTLGLQLKELQRKKRHKLKEGPAGTLPEQLDIFHSEFSADSGTAGLRWCRSKD
mgnify:CR=1 FL=1